MKKSPLSSHIEDSAKEQFNTWFQTFEEMETKCLQGTFTFDCCIPTLDESTNAISESAIISSSLDEIKNEGFSDVHDAWRGYRDKPLPVIRSMLGFISRITTKMVDEGFEIIINPSGEDGIEILIRRRGQHIWRLIRFVVSISRQSTFRVQSWLGTSMYSNELTIWAADLQKNN